MRTCVPVLAVSLVLLLAACGGESEQAPSRPDGAASPQELVGDFMRAAAVDDFEAFLALTHPDQRSFLTLFLGVMPVSTLVTTNEKLIGGIGSMLPADRRAAEITRLDIMKMERDELWKKYGIDARAKGEPAAWVAGKEKPEAAMALGKEMLGDIDHVALIKDAQRFLDKHMTSGRDKADALKRWRLTLGPVEASDTEATAAIAGRPDALRMLKSGNRWYADLLSLR